MPTPRRRPTAATLVVSLLATACAAPAGPVAPGPAAPTVPAPATYTAAVPGTDVTFDMVWIPEGGFWIGRTEVTWDEYLLFCDFTEVDRSQPGVDAVSRPSKPLETFPFDREWGTGRRPAVGVSWTGARTYCRWLSAKTGHAYRLPTEAEWRLACGPAPEGPLDQAAWFDANSGDRTQEVGRKEPNAHGLHDMLGNLWEYCQNPYDPEQPEWAALRGGSWMDFAEDVTPDARLQFDEFWNMGDSSNPPGVWWAPDGEHLGFRVLRPGPEQATEHDEGGAS